MKRFEKSDNPDDQDKADQIRQKITEAWRSARERELNSADEAMIHFYAHERRARQALQRAQRRGEPRQPEARLLHRHPRRGQDAEVHQGIQGSTTARVSSCRRGRVSSLRRRRNRCLRRAVGAQ